MRCGNARGRAAILVRSFFPSSRIHLAAAIELDEDHIERPLLCSLVPRPSILNISLLVGGSPPILVNSVSGVGACATFIGKGYGVVLAVDGDANDPQLAAARRLSE